MPASYQQLGSMLEHGIVNDRCPVYRSCRSLSHLSSVWELGECKRTCRSAETLNPVFGTQRCYASRCYTALGGCMISRITTPWCRWYSVFWYMISTLFQLNLEGNLPIWPWGPIHMSPDPLNNFLVTFHTIYSHGISIKPSQLHHTLRTNSHFVLAPPYQNPYSAQQTYCPFFPRLLLLYESRIFKHNSANESESLVPSTSTLLWTEEVEEQMARPTYR